MTFVASIDLFILLTRLNGSFGSSGQIVVFEKIAAKQKISA